jgi:hypothetical protein
MQKKNDLQNSFKSRKEKTALSVEDIDRIAEQVEKPVIVAQPAPKTAVIQATPKTPVVQTTAKTTLVRAAEVAPVVEDDIMETIKTSLDFPVSVYEDMKISLFRKRRSMKDYIIDLVRQDLYGSK